MSRETWHWLLTLSGLGCEIVGLTWIVADASRARREEFGELGFFRRIGRWFAFWLFEQPSAGQKIHVGGATSRGSAGGAVSLIKSNETKLERLEREVVELRTRLEGYEKQVQERLSAVEEAAQRTAEELGGRISQVEARERNQRRAALRVEVRGARLFILGAILSAIANLV